MSPEQLRGQSLTSASDIFSLGMVLYELATGAHPFAAQSPFETAHAIAANEPKPPASVNPLIPRDLERLILSMLAKNAQGRPSADDIGWGLDELAQAHSLSAKHATSRNKGQRSRWVRRGIAAAFLAAILLFWLQRSNQSRSAFSQLRTRPLTSQAGWEASPAFSPDGKSVAFLWTERPDLPSQIYIKPLDSDTPTQLSHSDSEENIGGLAWSPDGARIAFKRSHGSSGAIYAITVPSGKETKLMHLRFADLSSSLDWSPDGTQLAFSDAYPGIDHLAIYLLDVRTGEERKVTSPPADIWGDWDPKFSPDGRMLAFKRVRTFLLDTIYLLPLAGGPPRLIRDDSKGIWGHAWTADGKSLILSTQFNGSVFALWRVPLNSRGEPVRISEGGFDGVTPVSSRKGNRIAWVNHLLETSIYRIPFAGHGAPTLLIGSTLHVQGCSYSRDGRIAFVSDRSGSWEIWTAWANGSHQVRVTNFGGPATDSPQWSPDGRHLAIATRTPGGNKVFILDCESTTGTTRCGQPKQFGAGPGTEKWADSQPSWSADGAYVYYTSNRSGHDEVWKQPLAGGAAVQVTYQGGFQPLESSDGKWLYFSKFGPLSIWRMPGSRPEPMDAHEAERLLIGPPHNVVPTGWTVTSDEVLFPDLAGNSRSATVRGYRVGTGKLRDIIMLPEILNPSEVTSLSASPDSKWLLYWQLDRAGSNVMVAEPVAMSPKKNFANR